MMVGVGVFWVEDVIFWDNNFFWITRVGPTRCVSKVLLLGKRVADFMALLYMALSTLRHTKFV